jgi:hypothetical protein
LAGDTELLGENLPQCHFIIIIIIGKTAPFWATAFLRRFCHTASGFHFFGFRNNNFFTEQGRQSCVQPPTGTIKSLYSCPPVTGWPSYTPRHWVPFSSPSTTRRATVEVLHTTSTPGGSASATISTTNPTWPDLGSKPGRSDGNRLNNALAK